MRDMLVNMGMLDVRDIDLYCYYLHYAQTFSVSSNFSDIISVQGIRLSRNKVKQLSRMAILQKIISKYFLSIFSIILLFEPEISSFLKEASMNFWILFATISLLIAFVNRNKMQSSLSNWQVKIQNFSISTYKRKMHLWLVSSDSKSIGRMIASLLQDNLSLKMSCIIFSSSLLRHYPIAMTTLVPLLIFTLTAIIAVITSLAFRKEIFIITVGIFIFAAFSPYIQIFLTLGTEINPFESTPVEIVNLLDINALNIYETANKLFLIYVPFCAFIVFCLFVVSSMSRYLLTFIINVLRRAFLSILVD
jgi:hypothetical protein